MTGVQTCALPISWLRDVTDALWRLGIESAPTGTWNVATGRATTITELADAVERACGIKLNRVFGLRRPGDVTSSVVSASRLKALGWLPQMRLSAGIAELLDGTRRGLERRP